MAKSVIPRPTGEQRNPGKRLFSFRRNWPDGEKSRLVGYEIWAVDADAAMRLLRLTFGHTAKQGWYAEDMTDNMEFRKWAGEL